MPNLSPPTAPEIVIMQTAKGCDDANFAVTGGTEGCHNDNPRYRQWRRSWHHGNSQVLVAVA